ncbi:acetate--CoA ligase family protein [Rhodococcus sp. T2V]|uniref:acetate--CoA ligase family protein n=1 Tax=Rhodococcus sp. T2V TaxID=3034164 RepID=UPI0023E136C4|nr:acetate--CoA ligase family protein [Rhodococcus sp. T2V]MDF3308208.1 acetate--CoA ligase family protein [Rhodococcus sp. T2V]
MPQNSSPVLHPSEPAAGAAPESHSSAVPAHEQVPEHRVKAMLTRYGIDVPAGATFSCAGEAAEAVSGLHGPLVLKAFGPGLLHKSDVGAVVLGLAADDVPAAAAKMEISLAGKDLVPTGYLVEQQHRGGLELIVGVVRDSTFGHVVLLGLGGIATEMLDLSALRVAPLTREDAEALVDGFPGAPLLEGARGRMPADRGALVDFLLAIAGEQGMIHDLGDRLEEFECNPIVVTSSGVQALDARLILNSTTHAEADPAPATDFSRLFAPRAIAVAGASTSRSTFGNRFLAAYRAAEWNEHLYALHPQATEVDGVPAFPSIEAMPSAVDYVVVAVPANAAPKVVADAASAGVGFVHVVTGGFAEMGEAGAALQNELARGADGTKTRILGPNCLGVFAPGGRQTFTLGSPIESGFVSVVSQSGGLSGDMITVGSRRGIRFSKLVSIGNAIDVTHGELVDWLVDDPETRVIGIYLEGTRDGSSLLHALRRAKGTKPVVVLRGGSSAQGSVAVSSHTGSMASSTKVWSAIAESTGAVQVGSLEDFLSCLSYFQQYIDHQRAADADGVLVIGLGGGASVLATDACDRAGLRLTPLRGDLRRELRERGYGAGTSVANPLEVPVGPASPPSILVDALTPVFAPEGQSFQDLLIHFNAAAYYNYGTAGIQPMIDSLHTVIEAEFPVRVAVVIRNADVCPPSDIELVNNFSRESGVAVYRGFDEAASAVAAAQCFDARRIPEA